MDWRRSDDSAERFSAYLDEIAGVMGHAARVGPDARLLLGVAAGLREEERGADRGGDGPQRDQREASVAVALSRQGRVVRREGARQGARSRAAADRAARADRGLDHRRHELPQVRVAFGGRVAPILRPARQAGQLPSRRLAVGGQSRREPSRRLSAVSSRELGEGRCAPQARPAFPTRSSFRPSRRSRFSRSNGRARPALRAAWCEMDCAYGSDLSLRRRLTALDLTYAVGVWARTLVRKAEPGNDKPVHGCRSRQQPAEAGLAHDRLARRHQRAARLALRPRAGVRRRRGHDQRGARGVADRRGRRARRSPRNSGCRRCPRTPRSSA